MSTSASPMWKLKAEANNIAKMLKAAARGEKVANDPAGKIAAALGRESVSFAVVMDDKILKVEMPWTKIRETSEAGIAAYIVDYMRGSRATVQ